MTSADLTARRAWAAVSALWSAPAWRANANVLAALAVAAVGGILLVGFALVWVAAIDSLVNWPVGGWAHAALYAGAVAAGPVLALWALQGLTALQRSRLRATQNMDMPAGSAAAAVGYLAAGPPLAAGVAACIAAAALLLAAPWLARQVTRADAALARALLGPGRSEALALRLESLTRSRADVVAAAYAERRRIERDLHDGAQERLVSLAMNLDMAGERLVDAPEPARTPRELQVLHLMAEGRSNGGVVAMLKVSPSAVEKYVTNIFAKLDLPPTGTDHRRVLAVLKYLGT